jgi:hypothetical protein
MVVRLDEEGLLLSLVVACYIWLRRNAFVFGSVFTPPKQVMCQAQEAATFFLRCHDPPVPLFPNQAPIIPRWIPPFGGFLKLNWDAAFNKNSRSIGGGGCVKG